MRISNNKVSVASNPNLKNPNGYQSNNRINRSQERNKSKNAAIKFSTIQNDFDAVASGGNTTYETISKPQGKSSMQKFKPSHSKKSSMTTKATKFKKTFIGDPTNQAIQNQHIQNNFINESSQEYLVTNTQPRHTKGVKKQDYQTL